jgi:hypothetical protein
MSGKYSQIFKILGVTPVLAVFTGCTPHRETFDCAPGTGVGCKSISEVNLLIDNRAPPEESSKEQGLEPQKPPSVSADSPSLRVWMAPYDDRQGHLHEESFVVLRPKPIDLEKEEGEPK